MWLGRSRRGAEAGAALTAIYRRAWRPHADAIDLAPDVLAQILPSLLRAGGGPIAWSRLKSSPLAPGHLRDVFRFQCAAAVAWREMTSRVSRALQEAGIDALIGKGWTLARRYPELALRPYGDVDVLVRDSDRVKTEAMLTATELTPYVDLHVRWAGCEDVPFDALMDRSQLVSSDGVTLRCLSAEDNLRFLCIHYAKHGGSRPVWLCDIGLCLEDAPADLDWGRVVGRGAQRRSVEAILSLTITLLGASPRGLERLPAPPRWLLVDTERTWLDGVLHPTRELHLSDVRHLGENLSERFPNALRATHMTNASYQVGPRLPLRVSASLLRLASKTHERLRLLTS